MVVQQYQQPGGRGETKRYFRRTDAHEVRPRFILGETIDELAEVLAERRRLPVDQAKAFLERVRAEEGWIAERKAHLAAAESLVRSADMENRAAAIMSTQDAIGERLIYRGLDEVTTTAALTRSDALRTLEMGFKFRYRAAGLPASVTDPSALPPVGNLDGRATVFQQLSDEEFKVEVARRLAGFAPIAGLIAAAVEERASRAPEPVEAGDDGDDGDDEF